MDNMFVGERTVLLAGLMAAGRLIALFRA